MTGTRNYLGQFHYTVDVKGRVNIPARFRNARPEETEFVVTTGIEPCLYVVPSMEWLKFERSLEGLSTLVLSHRTFLRNQTRYATPPTSFDQQGRLLVPKNLLEKSNINKEVVIIGVLSKIEIWSPESLNEYERTKADLTEDEYKELAGRISL